MSGLGLYYRETCTNCQRSPTGCAWHRGGKTARAQRRAASQAAWQRTRLEREREHRRLAVLAAAAQRWGVA